MEDFGDSHKMIKISRNGNKLNIYNGFSSNISFFIHPRTSSNERVFEFLYKLAYIFLIKTMIFFSPQTTIFWTIFSSSFFLFSFFLFFFSFRLWYSIRTNVFDETPKSLSSPFIPFHFFVIFSLKPIPQIFLAFSMKLIHLWSNLWWNLIHLMLPRFDHLIRWSQSKLNNTDHHHSNLHLFLFLLFPCLSLAFTPLPSI